MQCNIFGCSDPFILFSMQKYSAWSREGGLTGVKGDAKSTRSPSVEAKYSCEGVGLLSAAPGFGI